MLVGRLCETLRRLLQPVVVVVIRAGDVETVAAWDEIMAGACIVEGIWLPGAWFG